MDILDIVNPYKAPVYYMETVTSTMDISRELAERGEPSGTVITADFQESGRGRIRNRSWEMESGKNLAFTIMLRYPPPLRLPSALTLRTGLAVCLAIEDFMPLLKGRVFIKWPNDILISETALSNCSHSVGITAKKTTGITVKENKSKKVKKTAGILAESDGTTVHIGIGVNITQREFPAHLANKATSLSLGVSNEIAAERRFDLLQKIICHLYDELESSTPWHSKLEERLYKKGERVTFIEGQADSGKQIEALLTGIGPDGELLLTPDGTTTALPFFSGELQL